jgi:hypothetical protein
MKKSKYYYVTVEVDGTSSRAGRRAPVLAGLEKDAVLAAAKELAGSMELPPMQTPGYLTFHTMVIEGSGKQMLPSLHAHMTERCSFVGDPEEEAAIDDWENEGLTEILDAVFARRFKERAMQ